MTTSTSAPRCPLCGQAFRRPSGCWWCYKQFASMDGRQALMCSGFNSLQMTWLCRRATYLQPGPFAFCVRGWLFMWRWITWVRYGFGVGESLSFMRVHAPSWFRNAYKGWFPRIHPPVPTHAQLAYSARALRVTGTHQASLSFCYLLVCLHAPIRPGVYLNFCACVRCKTAVGAATPGTCIRAGEMMCGAGVCTLVKFGSLAFAHWQALQP